MEGPGWSDHEQPHHCGVDDPGSRDDLACHDRDPDHLHDSLAPSLSKDSRLEAEEVELELVKEPLPWPEQGLAGLHQLKPKQEPAALEQPVAEPFLEQPKLLEPPAAV